MKKDKQLPAYFLSLTIENVRCFKEKQTLDLSDGNGRPAQWTILLGDNGTGKTTILQCLAQLEPKKSKQSKEIVFVPRLTYHAFQFIPSQNLQVKVNADIFFGRLNTIGRDTIIIKEYGFRFNQNDLIDFGIKLENDTTEFLLTNGYGASRRSSQSKLTVNESHWERNASLFTANHDLINAEEWLLQADWAVHNATNNTIKNFAENRYHRIQEILINILPDVYDIRPRKVTKAQLTPAIEVETPYGWVPIREVSFGYQTLIAWVIDFASRMFDRYPNSKNPLSEPAICLVDEIDLHLHPKWQRMVMDFLSSHFPNTQFIVSAHSPLIVQSAKDANIVLLRRDGDHVIIDNDVENVKGWRLDQIIASDLFGNISSRPSEYDEILKQRRVLMNKDKLTKKEEEELKQITDQLNDLPVYPTFEDEETLMILREAAASQYKVKKKKKGNKKNDQD